MHKVLYCTNLYDKIEMCLFNGGVLLASGVYCVYFLQVSHEAFGTTVTTNLLPNGNNIPVTSENRKRMLLPY